jgi:hypothetical protein
LRRDFSCSEILGALHASGQAHSLHPPTRRACPRQQFPKSTTDPNRWNQIKTAQAACGGWESPTALRHIQPGRWMAIPGGCAACTAGDPDGTRTDGPHTADLHWAAHSTSPIVSLRSSAVRRCDNYHGIVELGCTPRSSLRRTNTVRSIRSWWQPTHGYRLRLTVNDASGEPKGAAPLAPGSAPSRARTE